MQERKLSKSVERIAKSLPDAEFKKRYGKDWMSVKIATAEKMAKKNEAIDLGSAEPIVSALLLILGPLGIYMGLEKLRKLAEKYVVPLRDKFAGKIGEAVKFLKINAKELRKAAKESQDAFEQKMADLISDLYENDINEASRTKKGKKVNPKYLKGLKGKGTYGSKEAMKKEIDKFAGKKTYQKDWYADHDDEGKRIKTKVSAATKAYKQRFGEQLNEANIDKALKNKAEKSGIPMSILRQVYNKGKAAWNTGHRPGASQDQWAMGRVNSFITGSGGARKADAKLWARAKKARGKKRKSK